ncbi:MAG: hypothetical protein GY710_16485 [Desulfobacteraceae bacterium]|nr:hypothetical protein [Desulfobacteraceae bacterium]
MVLVLETANKPSYALNSPNLNVHARDRSSNAWSKRLQSTFKVVDEGNVV